MTAPQAQVRARLALAVAARDVADHARGLIGNLSTPQTAAQRVLAARRLRTLAMAVLDSVVLIEVANGTDWVELGEALGLSESEARHRYGETARMWLDDEDSPGLSVAIFGGSARGMHPDDDPAGLAESVEQWYQRHRDPWETHAPLDIL